MPPSKAKTRRAPAKIDVRLKTRVQPGALTPVVARVDRGLRYVEASEEYARRLGVARADLIGRKYSEIIPAENWEQMRPYAEKALLGLAQSFSVVVELRGGERLVEGHFLPQAEGGFTILAFDRSQSVRAEKGYEALFDQAVEGIAECDLDGKIVRANDRYCEIVGRSRETLLGMNVAELTYPGDEVPRTEQVAKDGPTLVEKRLVRPDGTPVWVKVSRSVLRGTDGRPLGLIGVVHDLTARRRAQEALRLSEERHRAIGEASPVGLFQTTLDGKLSYINARGAQLHGAATESLLGGLWLELVHPEDRPGVLEKIRASRAAGAENVMEYRIIRPDGEIRWLSGKSAPMRDVEGKIIGYAGVVDDITERRLVELERAALLRQVQDERRKLSDIMDSLPAIVWEARGLKVEELRVAFMSPYASELLGAPMTGSTSGAAMSTGLVHPEDREVALEAVRRAMSSGKPELFEFRAVAASGRVIWLEARVRPILDRFGRAIGTRGVALDITARKQAEEAARRHEAAQREFIANVSHDFRTPLASIKGYSETLLRGADKETRATRLRFTRSIFKSALRLEELVEDILQVSALEAGVSKPEPDEILLASFVDDLSDGLGPLLKGKALKLRVKIPATLAARADRRHLGQILDNLVSNAVRYNTKGGWVEISARRVSEIAARWVELCVSDNGVGISAEDLPRVWDRFYRVDRTRSAASKASGLGLHIVKRLVEAAGGRVWAESKPGRGSKFYFTVPLAE